MECVNKYKHDYDTAAIGGSADDNVEEQLEILDQDQSVHQSYGEARSSISI